MSHARAYLLVDANVLIDYLVSDLTILTLASRRLGEVHVLSTVLDEVDGINAGKCEQNGLKVIEPDLAQLMEASKRRSALSTEDHLCLIVARERGWTCVTNDRALRRACMADGVPVLWGLELMKELVRIAELRAKDAIAVAESIHMNNPLHISRTLVDQFAKQVRSIEGTRRGA